MGADRRRRRGDGLRHLPERQEGARGKHGDVPFPDLDIIYSGSFADCSRAVRVAQDGNFGPGNVRSGPSARTSAKRAIQVVLRTKRSKVTMAAKWPDFRGPAGAAGLEPAARFWRLSLDRLAARVSCPAGQFVGQPGRHRAVGRRVLAARRAGDGWDDVVCGCTHKSLRAAFSARCHCGLIVDRIQAQGQRAGRAVAGKGTMGRPAERGGERPAHRLWTDSSRNSLGSDPVVKPTGFQWAGSDF